MHDLSHSAPARNVNSSRPTPRIARQYGPRWIVVGRRPARQVPVFWVRVSRMDRDRRFFQRHPTITEYTRDIVPGEFPPDLIPRGRELQGRVTVRQVAPGFRIRFAP
jgi:hypothetical protein